jgi:DNA-binding protein HU-beta
MNPYHKERQILKKSQKSTRKVFFKEKKPIYLQAKNLETYCITYKIFIEMTKADIVNEISKRTGVDKVTVLSSVETFMDVVKESLAKEENVYLRGFGSFIVKKRAQKTARNISKNTTIIIPEHNIPSFKPAKTFVSEVKK